MGQAQSGAGRNQGGGQKDDKVIPTYVASTYVPSYNLKQSSAYLITLLMYVPYL